MQSERQRSGLYRQQPGLRWADWLELRLWQEASCYSQHTVIVFDNTQRHVNIASHILAYNNRWFQPGKVFLNIYPRSKKFVALVLLSWRFPFWAVTPMSNKTDFNLRYWGNANKKRPHSICCGDAASKHAIVQHPQALFVQSIKFRESLWKCGTFWGCKFIFT